VVARKPLIGTVAANVLAHGTGALNIDASRIPASGDDPNVRDRSTHIYGDTVGYSGGYGPARATPAPYQIGGRWPSNVILSHHPACVEVGVRRVKGSRIEKPCESDDMQSGYSGRLGGRRPARGHGDPDGTETVSDWDCHEECAVAALDAQSGERPGFRTQTDRKGRDKFAGVPYGTGMMMPAGERQGFNDTGGASRFFLTVAPDLPIDGEDVTRFLYQAKASRSERSAGLGPQPARVKLRDDLTPEQRAWVLAELAAAGVAP
jgi:hypothetical protein